MQNALYSIIACIAIVMHSIIYFGTRRINPAVDRENRSYIGFQITVLVYYLIDAAWGFAAELRSDKLLYIQSMLCFVGMTVAAIMWNRFIISYLGEQGKARLYYQIINLIFAVFTVVALTVNFYKPVLFSIESANDYQQGCLRPVFWILQILLFSSAALRTGLVARRFTGARKQRYIMVFLFCFIMIGANILQSIYPLLPVCTIGYVIGNCVLYVYVFEDEKNADMKRHNGVIDALCRGIDDVFFVDFNHNSVSTFKLHGEIVSQNDT